jgi:glutamate-ammonia-ligase adenylyltransferase
MPVDPAVCRRKSSPIMPHFVFTDSMQSVPAPFDAAAVKASRQDWLDRAEHDLAASVLTDPATSALMDCLFGNSPFLGQAVLRDAGFVCELLRDGPDTAFARILSDLTERYEESLNDNDIARILRIAKRRAAITIALADIAGSWPLERVTGGLSDFAAGTLELALRHLLRQAASQNVLQLPHPDDPLKGSGLIVIGMGKLGARELNYSSDIDLIVLYDTDRIETSQPDRLQQGFVRLTRNLVKLMDERTADGYVFRTDLRLRPDPSAMPLAMSVLAAETYYESIGQNWERAAMIKARTIAGDMEAGEAFLKFLQPFIWRKSLDFAAIQDIHSIKRQINAHKGGTDIKTRGHNIKLGPGGIREIEFFAQTQQLIWGGREPSLRSPVTVEALAQLTNFGQCDPETARELTESYVFLRGVEHRLQMIHDEQPQVLPDHDEGYARLATFLGFGSADAFSDTLLMHLRRVHEHYAQLFPEAPSLGAEGSGNLVFTGGDPDPDTLKTIRAMGFKAPETVDSLVRAWHHGHHRATQSTRAREILTELMPRLLRALGATADPDAAFLRFDAFLKGLPAGVQLFSMFQANPHLLDLIAEIIGTAPRLARHMSSHPSVLDAVLTGDFFGDLPDADSLAAELDAVLHRAEYFEAKLDASRRWAHDHRFQVGVLRLQGSIDAETASRGLSDIAETVVGRLFRPVADEFANNHGVIAGGEMAIVALGKLGSREMSASSDLDLVFVYDVPADADVSDGNKPLAPTQYYARLGQRLINAITALTAEGSLYEVDMRLRPSGNAGPVATTTEAFRLYHAEQAWTWEHMAMTRARVVFATSDTYRAAVEAEIRDVLVRPRDPDKLLRDVADMRKRLAREKPALCLWSLKQLRGGMVDIEFIQQYLTLRHAADHPEILSSNTCQALDNLTAAGVLDGAIERRLASTLKFWHALQGMLSLTVEDDPTPERVAEFPEALKHRLARAGGAGDFTELETVMHFNAAEAYGLFQNLVEAPAQALPEPAGDNEEAPVPLI